VVAVVIEEVKIDTRIQKQKRREIPPLRKPTIQQEVGWEEKNWLAPVGMTGFAGG